MMVVVVVVVVLVLTGWRDLPLVVYHLGGRGVPAAGRAALVVKVETRMRSEVLRLVEITVGNSTLGGCAARRMHCCCIGCLGLQRQRGGHHVSG